MSDVDEMDTTILLSVGGLANQLEHPTTASSSHLPPNACTERNKRGQGGGFGGARAEEESKLERKGKSKWVEKRIKAKKTAQRIGVLCPQYGELARKLNALTRAQIELKRLHHARCEKEMAELWKEFNNLGACGEEKMEKLKKSHGKEKLRLDTLLNDYKASIAEVRMEMEKVQAGDSYRSALERLKKEEERRALAPKVDKKKETKEGEDVPSHSTQTEAPAAMEDHE